MKRTALLLFGAASLSLAGCASTNDDDTLASAGTGAAIGAAAGAGAGAVIGGLSPIEGALIGAAVGGVAGAVWADRDNDGYADGYTQNGQYYSGRPAYASATPRDCKSVLGGAATGAGVGAVAGAGLGAVVGGINPLEGALIGAAVGGVAGAVWADRDNDGYADGYTQNGQYYSGRPAYASATPRDCKSVLGGAATGAGVGAVAGAGLGAVVGGINPLEGALIGAAVGGIGGAVWTDRNNDGCVDGYTREGQYYEGGPVVQPVSSSPTYAGERG